MNRGATTLAPVLAETRRRVQADDQWAPHLPERFGGPGLLLPEFARVSEELGRSPLGHYLFNCQAPDVGNMEVLMTHGTGEQQARHLPLHALDWYLQRASDLISDRAGSREVTPAGCWASNASSRLDRRRQGDDPRPLRARRLRLLQGKS